MDWSMASIATLRTLAWKAILHHCYGDNQFKTYKENLMATAFAVPAVFGPIPEILESKLASNGFRSGKLSLTKGV